MNINLVEVMSDRFGTIEDISNRIAQEESLIHTLSVLMLVEKFVGLLEKIEFKDKTPVLSVSQGRASDVCIFNFSINDKEGLNLSSDYHIAESLYQKNQSIIKSIRDVLRSPPINTIDSLCIDFTNNSLVVNIELTSDKNKNTEILLSKLLAQDQMALVEKIKLDKELSQSDCQKKKLKV